MPKLPSKEYWEARSERTLIANEKSALQYERDLKKAYNATIKQITKEIEAFYGRYAKENQISLAEARKRLTPNELLDFHQHAKIYLDEIERLGDKAFTAEYKAYLKELSGRAYVSRIEELTTNIRHNIETLSTGYNTGLGQILTEAYQDGFYRTMFDIQKQAGFGISFTTPGGKQLEMAIRERWVGQNYSDRIWADKNKLIIQLEQMLSQEFVRGRGPREVAKDFSDKMQTSYYNAQRLIRTELNYISNKGSMKAYEESGVVEKYQYLATLDNRTSDICRELDGKIFELKEAKVGVNLPPLHPHCRSTTIPYYEDDEISEYIEDRVARREDGTGKSYKLGKDVTFFEWVDQYGSPEYKKKVEAQRRKFLEMDRTPTELYNDSLLKESSYSVFEKVSKEYSAEYKKKLTDEEVEAIRKYQSIWYLDMNSFLRGRLESASKKLRTYVTNLQKAIKKVKIKENILVARGTTASAIGGDWDAAQINDIIKDKGFTSTSLREETAIDFVNRKGERGILMYVKIPKGTNGVIVDVAVNDNWESELLIEPGTKIRITGKRIENGMKIVEGVVVNE